MAIDLGEVAQILEGLNNNDDERKQALISLNEYSKEDLIQIIKIITIWRN
jgi:hypothetical protein